MLRWLIAILLVANLVALAAIQGLFGPPPAAGAREPWHLTQQVRPQALHTTAVAQAAEQPVVGGPISSPPIESQPLAASSADAGAEPGAASAATPGSAPGSAPAVPAAPSATSSPSASTSPAHLAQLEHLAPLAAATLAVAPAALAEGKRRRAAASRLVRPPHKLRA
ncbi:hypothetical protein [Burkholderia gladioli]|uniref:hypothetical protein n=1 Tax=Burkholderia gladioli TaxID=28095 RepID=UPI001D1056BB|nr:hypothetical protein [Burkholderia gladioli]MDN8064555.1 hypothetical protein [Burkholderia gladioli]